MSNEREMLDLLLDRYSTERQGTIADRYVRAEHVRSTQNYYGVSIADFLAIDKYSTSQSVIGHEVKVSRSDWLSELRNPEKSERIKRYCDYWHLVVSDAAIVKPGELPEGWGLIVRGTTGKLRVKTKAPKLTPEPMPLDFVCGLTAAVQRTAMREPLRKDSRTIWLYSKKRGHYYVCQACGETSPCRHHQPRKADNE